MRSSAIGGGSSAPAARVSRQTTARIRAAIPGARAIALLATAAAARGRAVPARRALARVVELLPAVGVERLVGEVHHRIGQVYAPVLGDGRAREDGEGEQTAQRERGAERARHSGPPSAIPAAVPRPDAAGKTRGETIIDPARSGAKEASTMPMAEAKRAAPKSDQITRCCSRVPCATAAG